MIKVISCHLHNRQNWLQLILNAVTNTAKSIPARMGNIGSAERID